MRIVCPHCEATYEIPDAMLGRRAVRCARCGETWHPSPPAGAAAEAGLPAPAPSAPPVAASLMPVDEAPPVAAHTGASPAYGAPDTLPDLDLDHDEPRLVAGQRAPRRRGLAGRLPPRLPVDAPIWAGWIATALVLSWLAWGAYTYRARVMEVWPPSIRLYAALGLDHQTP